MEKEFIMEDDILQKMIELATITEENIKKTREWYISLEQEERNKLKKEITTSMTKKLEEITNYLLEEKQKVLSEIEKFKKLKYSTLDTLESMDIRYKTHIWIENIYYGIYQNGCRCAICRQDGYGEIKDPNYYTTNYKNIIPRSIYENKFKISEYTLEEINTKLYELYIRYQIILQVSYNICTIFDHNEKYTSSDQYNCPRCGMSVKTFAILNPHITLEPTITKKKRCVNLNFLHKDYLFSDVVRLFDDWKYLLSLDKKVLTKLLCSDINIKIKEEDLIVDDEVFKETINKSMQELKNKAQTRAYTPRW